MKSALFRDEWSCSPAVPRSCILSPGLLCILNQTINSRQCQGVDASAVRENHGIAWVETQTGGSGLSGKEVESGRTAGSVNLSRIQRGSESTALQSELRI